MDGGGDTLREEKGVSGGKCAKVKTQSDPEGKEGRFWGKSVGNVQKLNAETPFSPVDTMRGQKTACLDVFA